MAGWTQGFSLFMLFLSVGAARAGEMQADTARRGLEYWGSDPYAALAVAKQQRKLLLVEFYADWNHRSRWMSERVLGDSAVRSLVEARFVAVQVPTGTADGADLAGVYQVTGYPAILIFNANGDVLDKIDVTLDPEDFEQRIQTILMAVQGTGTWRLRQVYAAAEQSDTEATDAAVAQFLGGQLPQDVANGVVWPMFENSVVTRYGSTAFNYLISHVDLFRQEIGREEVDAVLTDALLQSMLPYVVGSVPYGADVAEAMIRTAESLELPAVLSLQSMSDVAALREAEDLSLFVARLGLLLDVVPESYHLPLAMSLDIVAERGSREARGAALKIVNRVHTSLQSPANAAMLELLRDRLK
ncbi:MAG: thioredoxin family protein [Rikenellaceae bacterium]|nr:thioredoxin family protein [Rikenellaceae bacterium]